MPHINRRAVLAAGGVAAVNLPGLFAAGGTGAVDEVLRSGIARRKVPAVVGMAASENKTLYAGAFGTRDASGVPVHAASIFQIASMTKAVTTVAALQLVEQGKVTLRNPSPAAFHNSPTSMSWRDSMRPANRRCGPPGRP
jgi:CubicO group peptidase (beta-lactamase class C family)